jgi:hypothetical protein
VGVGAGVGGVGEGAREVMSLGCGEFEIHGGNQADLADDARALSMAYGGRRELSVREKEDSVPFLLDKDEGPF